MHFINAFVISALVACVAYYSTILALIDAPIPGEYWVREMLVVKNELVKEYAGRRKIIIAGGSSTLLSINAEMASEQLGLPVINFGLHAELKLEKILREVSAVVENGDILILPLEPSYYDCRAKYDIWQIENIIAWDHDTWKDMNYAEKIEFISLVSPHLLGKMVTATFQKYFHDPIISKRLDTFDNSSIRQKFRVRQIPTKYKMSAYNLNDHGDLLRTEGTIFKVNDDDLRKPDHVCDKSADQLTSFQDKMKSRGVQVFFSNAPYAASEVNLDSLKSGETRFLQEFSRIGCFIDRREDLLFDPKYFFDFKLHLNAEGRIIRTNLLVQSIHKNILSGACGH